MSEREQPACQERRDDDLAGYAVGALSAADAAELRDHMKACPRCAARLDWLAPAVHLVPASVAQLEPPAELGSRLMAVVREEAAEAGNVAREPDSGGRTQAGSRRRGAWLQNLVPSRPALAGFATVALLVAGVGGYVIRGGDRDGQTFSAFPASPKSAAVGSVMVEDGAGTLRVEGLPPIPQDEVYQVWISRDDELSPSSIFVLDHSGAGSATIPELPGDAEAIMVTREPSGGSEVNTTQPVLTAELD